MFRVHYNLRRFLCTLCIAAVAVAGAAPKGYMADIGDGGAIIVRICSPAGGARLTVWNPASEARASTPLQPPLTANEPLATQDTSAPASAIDAPDQDDGDDAIPPCAFALAGADMALLSVAAPALIVSARFLSTVFPRGPPLQTAARRSFSARGPPIFN